MRIAALLIFPFLALTACAPNLDTIPQVTDKMASEFGVEKQDLEKGREIYMAHCNKCHERVPPGKIDPEYWRGIVPHMSLRAHINHHDEELLQNYLIAAHGTVHGLDLEH